LRRDPPPLSERQARNLAVVAACNAAKPGTVKVIPTGEPETAEAESAVYADAYVSAGGYRSRSQTEHELRQEYEAEREAKRRARRTPTPPAAPAPITTQAVAPIARPRERRDTTRRSSSSSSSSSSSDPDPPPPARPALDRNARRRRAIIEGPARKAYAELDAQLEDALAADRGPTRGQLVIPGLEGRGRF
jgi:hypothetical protein